MAAYYNEFDAGAAAWLRELIKRGLIADGIVDDRSILEVQPDDLRGYTQCHFFAGIGGWSYALRLAGWPDDRPVWTGSPPCQPFSAAGRQKGKDDERHLAPHWATLIAAGRPPVIFGEQVASAAVFGGASKRTGGSPDGEPEWAWIDDLFGRLEAARYACGAVDLPAAGVGAAHIRQRTFFGAIRLADADGEQRHEGLQSLPRGSAERSGRDCQPVGMGDPNEQGSQEHWEPGDVHLRQPDGQGQGRQHLDAGVSGGLAHAEISRRGEERPLGNGIREGDGAQGRAAGFDAGSNIGGLADAYRERSGFGNGGCSGEGSGAEKLVEHTGGLRPLSRLADAACDRWRQGCEDAGGLRSGDCAQGTAGRSAVDDDMERVARPSADHGGWADADWLFCRDGKWRPVEPVTFPLAHGLPARVVRLRGYGNAIVPQAAAVFIQAFSEALKD